MKTATLALMMLSMILIAGCTNQSDNSISDLVKKEIIREVTKTAYLTIEACNEIDLPTFKNFFLNSPDFLAVSSDGSFVNYEQKMNAEKDFFDSVSTLHLTTLNEDFKFLSKSSVVWTVQFEVNAVLKTGEKLRFDKLIVTEIFEKIDNQWKIIFSQESGMPPLVTK